MLLSKFLFLSAKQTHTDKERISHSRPHRNSYTYLRNDAMNAFNHVQCTPHSALSLSAPHPIVPLCFVLFFEISFILYYLFELFSLRQWVSWISLLVNYMIAVNQRAFSFSFIFKWNWRRMSPNGIHLSASKAYSHRVPKKLMSETTKTKKAHYFWRQCSQKAVGVCDACMCISVFLQQKFMFQRCNTLVLAAVLYCAEHPTPG